MTDRSFDPQGKRALFESPVAAPPDLLSTGNQKEGKDALYSSGPRQVGTVLVECASCSARSRTTLVDLGLRFLSVSVWLPGRRHSHWMRCPGCHEHTWCRVGWTE
jgi:hypothetical protein